MTDEQWAWAVNQFEQNFALAANYFKYRQPYYHLSYFMRKHERP